MLKSSSFFCCTMLGIATALTLDCVKAVSGQHLGLQLPSSTAVPVGNLFIHINPHSSTIPLSIIYPFTSHQPFTGHFSPSLIQHRISIDHDSTKDQGALLPVRCCYCHRTQRPGTPADCRPGPAGESPVPTRGSRSRVGPDPLENTN